MRTRSWAKLCPLILTALWISCASGSYVPRCPQWSEAALQEFSGYMRAHGQTAMVQAILRDAQTCRVLLELQ